MLAKVQDFTTGARKSSARLYGQVNKRIWWMPWQLKAMKDVATCDKPRRAGTGFDPRISEWGNPTFVSLRTESIGT